MTPRQIRAFLAAGNATFTLQSVPTGRHFTYRLKVGKDGPAFSTSALYASLLIAPDTYAYIGMVRPTTKHLIGRLWITGASKCNSGSPAFRALAWFLYQLDVSVFDDAADVHPDVIFRHEGRCGACARPLTTPESVDRGIGPDCFERLGQ